MHNLSIGELHDDEKFVTLPSFPTDTTETRSSKLAIRESSTYEQNNFTGRWFGSVCRRMSDVLTVEPKGFNSYLGC